MAAYLAEAIADETAFPPIPVPKRAWLVLAHVAFLTVLVRIAGFWLSENHEPGQTVKKYVKSGLHKFQVAAKLGVKTG